MKRIILTIMVAAFAVAVQAGDTKSCQEKCKDKDKPACCPSKAKAADKAKDGCCPFAKSDSCPKKDAAKKEGLQSPKAADAAK